MRHLRITVDLWILLPLSTAVRNALETAQGYVQTAKNYAEKVNAGAKNEENTVTATYDVVEHKGNRYVRILLDLAVLLPLSTAAKNAVDAARPRIRNMIQYASQPAEGDIVDPIKIHAKYHVCKHAPLNEPCDPEDDV